MSQRLKILISAYACSPIRGSEPGMGWGFVSALSRLHDIWVISEKEKFEKEVEDGLRLSPEVAKHVRFFFIQKTRHRRLRKIWPPSYYWFYREWQKKAFLLAQKLHDEIGFDIVHQLNMVGFREPGYLWRLNAPFVWGPIGGFVQMPMRFSGLLGGPGIIYYLGRNFYNQMHSKMLRRPKIAASCAGTGLIAATSDTSSTIKALWKLNSQIICEVGLPVTQEKFMVNHRTQEEPLKIVWSGLHIPRKGLPLLLKALEKLKKRNWELHILGKGKETSRWKNLAEDLNINQHCSWHGWLSREDALKIMKQGHLFLISSLQDLTSTVIIEALSLGMPVVCLDHCGFSDVVTPDCGIKIPVTSPNQVINKMVEAIGGIEKDEPARRLLAQNARNRAEKFCWENKAEQLNRIYKQRMAEWANENSTGS